MKKLILILVLFLFACTKEDPTVVGHHYQLQSKGPIDITLDFHPDGHFSGHAVNAYTGIYTITGTNITLTLQSSTMRLAPKIHLSAENDYFHTLKEIQKYQIKEDHLFLIGPKHKLEFVKLNSN